MNYNFYKYQYNEEIFIFFIFIPTSNNVHIPKTVSHNLTILQSQVGDIREVSIPNVGQMKVRDLEVKDHGETHLVTVWDNACVYIDFNIGDIIRLTDVLTGWNKFQKRNHVIIRYEDQIEVNMIYNYSHTKI